MTTLSRPPAPRPFSEEERPLTAGRARIYDVIFLADNPAGKAFDVLLLAAIFLSIVTVVLESVESVRAQHQALLNGLEWFFTLLFTVEYGLRLISVRRASRYATSFFGIVDLLATAPTYLSLLVPGAQTLLIIRTLRLLRVFRVFKMARYLGEAKMLMDALRVSRVKITVFLGAVLAVVTILGSLMYLVEGPEHGFTSIPRGMYWAIVTMTTVGYGDIAPETVPGQFIAAFLMILGYGIIAVPTGIVTVEMASAAQRPRDLQTCSGCGATQHDPDAQYCKGCGGKLERIGET